VELPRLFIEEKCMDPLATSFIHNTESKDPHAGRGILIREVQERRVRQVVEMIDSEPSHSIRDLALKVLLSPAHLQRLFKRQTGAHLGDFVVERRLQKAAQLLTVTNLPIKEIAYSVGYRHHSSFVRAFQRRFSEAPRHYRDQRGATTQDA
jgi:transcriptional regulator GlxA family with amidase domain